MDKLNNTATRIQEIKEPSRYQSISLGIGDTNVPISLDMQDRLRHTYIVGKTGMGKSSLLEHMISQDISAGR